MVPGGNLAASSTLMRVTLIWLVSIVIAASEPSSAALSEPDASNASAAPAEPPEINAAGNDAPAPSAAAPKKRKKSAASKKRRKAPPKKQSTRDAVFSAMGGSLSSLKEKAAAFRGEFKTRYEERVRELEEQAELERLERAQLELKRRERVEELRAELKRRGVKRHVQDIAEAQAAAEEGGAELTLSEQAALLGTLLGSPAGIVGVVLGGAAGSAVGMIAEKAEQVHSAVREAYSERLQVERDATEQQEGMVEELQSYGDVTFVEQCEEPESVDACREELLEFIAQPANIRCADCNCKLSAAQDAWASVNLGVLVCMRCAALHRGLGVSNSRIKSLVYDRWDMPTARGLMAVGNERAHDLYLGNLPASVKPPGKKADEERLKTFIHNKYIKLKWADSEWKSTLTESRKSTLTESRLRASKVAAATVRGRRTKTRTKTSKIIGKMPSLSSEG